MVDVAEVWMWGQFVGAVKWNERNQLGSFQYDSSFVKNGFDISPIKMPISAGSRVYRFPELRMQKGAEFDTFKGLPGLLADTLPDKFGSRILNEWLTLSGRNPNSVNPIERLCYIGDRGMGALEFQPAQSSFQLDSTELEVDGLVNAARKVLSEKATLNTEWDYKQKAIVDILKVGTSAGGARPKAIVAISRDSKIIMSGHTLVPDGFEHWLLKLDGVSGVQVGDSFGWGRVEYAYYLMAKKCGINISESKLIEENGRAHFMTKRFDRVANQKIHMQTFCAMNHFDFNEMNAFSYEQLFQTMRQLKLTYSDAEEMFKRMVFNVVATNYDDHTKNFSFLMDQSGIWKLSPAYDICYSYNPDNHWVSKQTLSINGKRESIQLADLLTIAKFANIKQPLQIIKEVNDAVMNWHDFASVAGVNEDLALKIRQNLNIISIP